MSSKVAFIFVVIVAISFVHSFPKLSDENNENAQMAKLMALTQKALSKLKDKSNENVDSTDAYIDMIFDIIFDEDDSSEESTDLAFGPAFDLDQLFTLLSADIEKAYQRKCKKISGSDETFGKVKAASKEMGRCLKGFVKSEEIRTAYSNLSSEEDIQTLIRTLCRKRDVPIKCVDDYMEIDAECSFPRELEIDNKIRRVVYGLMDLACANDGNDLISMIFGQGRQCLAEHTAEVQTCQYKEVYAIVRGLLVKLIENETFEWKMDAEDCKAYDEIQACYVSSVENCADPTLKNYVTSAYQLVRNETECAKMTPNSN